MKRLLLIVCGVGIMMSFTSCGESPKHHENEPQTQTEITAVVTTETTEKTTVADLTEQVVEPTVEDKNTETTTFETVIETEQSVDIVPVKRLVATRSESCSFFGTATDPRGKDYFDVLLLSSHSSNWIASDGLIEFYTGKEYSVFSCDIVPESGYSTESGYGGRIKIYSDDDLVYVSEIITYKTTSIHVDLDISDTDYLKIRIENVNQGGMTYAYADTMLVNPTVSK